MARTRARSEGGVIVAPFWRTGQQGSREIHCNVIAGEVTGMRKFCYGVIPRRDRPGRSGRPEQEVGRSNIEMRTVMPREKRAWRNRDLEAKRETPLPPLAREGRGGAWLAQWLATPSPPPQAEEGTRCDKRNCGNSKRAR